MRSKKARTGEKLEREVADLYRELGARNVQHDVDMLGNQIDVCVELPAAGFRQRLAVEVKNITRRVGKAIVNDFARIAHRLREKEIIDEGVIVSAPGFTRQARDAAQAHGITLLKMSDLKAKVEAERQSMLPSVTESMGRCHDAFSTNMITNERQRKVTRGQVTKLESALDVARKTPEGAMDRRVYRAMLAGIESQIAELQEQLSEYERLTRASSLRLRSADELGNLLLQARVARNLTQEALAGKLNIKPQQIQRYEATFYRSASLKRILEIMRALDVDFDAEVSLAAKVESG